MHAFCDDFLASGFHGGRVREATELFFDVVSSFVVFDCAYGFHDRIAVFLLSVCLSSFGVSVAVWVVVVGRRACWSCCVVVIWCMLNQCVVDDLFHIRSLCSNGCSVQMCDACQMYNCDNETQRPPDDNTVTNALCGHTTTGLHFGKKMRGKVPVQSGTICFDR